MSGFRWSSVPRGAHSLAGFPAGGPSFSRSLTRREESIVLGFLGSWLIEPPDGGYLSVGLAEVLEDSVLVACRIRTSR